MKEYKLVNLLEKKYLTRKKDLEEAEKVLNHYASKGWILQQMSDLGPDLIAVMYKEI